MKVKEQPNPEASPGPGGYVLPTGVGSNGHDPTRRMAPSFSFGSRYKDVGDNSPGPIYQVDSSITYKGKGSMPKYTLPGRWTAKKTIFVTPGPNNYNYTLDKKTPKYSFGTRLEKKDNTPGPGPNYLPSNSIGSSNQVRTAILFGRSDKFGHAHDWSKTPGPSTGWEGANANLRRPPAFSLQGRSHIPTDKLVTPAPGAYNVKSFGNFNNSPRFSLGARRPFNFAKPIYTLADVSD